MIVELYTKGCCRLLVFLNQFQRIEGSQQKLNQQKPISQKDDFEHFEREELIEIIKKMLDGGVTLSFHGKRTAQEIQRKVRPRATRVVKNLCVGEPGEWGRNLIIEGENLQAMVTLFKYRGQIDLIITDPPYNTGQQFRYNDRWDEDPNDPELGNIVAFEDGSRHTKWIKAMLPRLQMMRAMLKPSGVLAICIDDNELYHLGMMLDEVFGESNRIAIINWQKTYSPKNDSNHVSISTEYVLVYAKDQGIAKTGLLPRDEKMNARFENPDNDPKGKWAGKDPTAKEFRKNTVYAIQSPFSGYLHYPDAEYFFIGTVPEPNKHWTGISKPEMKKQLEAWGSKYIEKDLGDGRGKALVIADTKIKLNGYDPESDPRFLEAKNKALAKRMKSTWPHLIFLDSKSGGVGCGRPRMKNYLNDVKKGKVPMTYWASEDYDSPIVLGSQSWDHNESGHSQAGINELDSIMGKGHGFQTVKPLKLIKKIIHLWCPNNGIILDPYAGSGTTGHAVLELNHESDAQRSFILIEQGSPEKGDKYARTLTRERIRRVISGERPQPDGNLHIAAKPLSGSFEFRQLLNQIDAKAVLSMKREDLIDVVLTSHWDEGKRSEIPPTRLEGFNYLIGKNQEKEGYFIIWGGSDSVGQLDIDTYNRILKEAKKANVNPPYHIYARYELYQSNTVYFYKIPDKILAHLGLNEFSERYNEDEGGAI